MTLAPKGDDFSQPLPVNRRADSAVAIGNVRGAHLALGREDRVHVAWMGSDKAEPKAPEDALPMLYTRLNDPGIEFEPERNVIQRHVGLDGGGSLAADEQGNVYVAWHAPEAGRTGEANRRVWVARSEDEGRAFTPEQPATQSDGCCACCGMRAFAGRDGRLYLLFRSASETVHRDMFLLVSKQGDAGFASSRIAPWEVPGCVMSTAALSPAPFGVLAGWETEGQAYFGVVDANSGKLSRSIAAPGDAKDGSIPQWPPTTAARSSLPGPRAWDGIAAAPSPGRSTTNKAGRSPALKADCPACRSGVFRPRSPARTETSP